MHNSNIQSKGGKARAKALSRKQRMDSAKKAASVRWGVSKVRWGNPEKKLNIAGSQLECYVLENGRRIFTGKGMHRALGLRPTSKGLLRDLLAQSACEYLKKPLAKSLSTPIKFLRPGPGGKMGWGFQAFLLKGVCRAVLRAKKRRKDLSKGQEKVASKCRGLLQDINKGKLIARIDEITGYRSADEVKTGKVSVKKRPNGHPTATLRNFPAAYYKELFRLKGLKYPTQAVDNIDKAKEWTEDVVNSRLPDRVIAPAGKKLPGFLKRTNSVSVRNLHPILRRRLSNIVFLMKGCETWDDFIMHLEISAPKVAK